MYKRGRYQSVAVKALVLNKAEEVLLGRRLEDLDYGLYEMPGGTAEVGETLDQTLQREIEEETGVKAEIIDWSDGWGRPLYVTHNSIKRSLLVIFKARLLNEDNMMDKNEELDEIGFYTKDRVREFLEQQKVRKVFVPALESYLKGG